MRQRESHDANKTGVGHLQSAGFSLIELLIVVAIILIIAAIAIPNLLRSRMAANEAATVQDMRAIITAEAAYNTLYGIGYSALLLHLGPAVGGGAPTPLAADLIENDLAAGSKSGYTFTYVPTAPNPVIRYDYGINTDPIVAGSTGQRHFFADQTGVIRFNAAAKATPADIPIS